MVLGALRQEYTSMFNLPPPGTSFASATGHAVPPQRNVRKGSYEPVTGIGEQRHGKETGGATAVRPCPFPPMCSRLPLLNALFRRAQRSTRRPASGPWSGGVPLWSH